jgi:hypothetical protein
MPRWTNHDSRRHDAGAGAMYPAAGNPWHRLALTALARALEARLPVHPGADPVARVMALALTTTLVELAADQIPLVDHAMHALT